MEGAGRLLGCGVGGPAGDAGGLVLPPARPAFEEIAGYFAFYAQAVDHCFVGEEEVIPQPGRYYGGWITANLTGPFKGVPGSEAW